MPYQEEAAIGRLVLWLAEGDVSQETVEVMTTLESIHKTRIMVIVTNKRLVVVSLILVSHPQVIFEVSDRFPLKCGWV